MNDIEIFELPFNLAGLTSMLLTDFEMVVSEKQDITLAAQDYGLPESRLMAFINGDAEPTFTELETMLKCKGLKATILLRAMD